MTLPTRTLGRTGETVTALGLGGVCWNLADEDAEAVAVVHRAIDLGITYLDTASKYKDSERRLGLALKDRDRDGLFLATKCMERSGEAVRQEIAASFEHLGVEQIDLMQLHAIDEAGTLEEVLRPDGALRVIEEYRRQGRDPLRRPHGPHPSRPLRGHDRRVRLRHRPQPPGRRQPRLERLLLHHHPRRPRPRHGDHGHEGDGLRPGAGGGPGAVPALRHGARSRRGRRRHGHGGAGGGERVPGRGFPRRSPVPRRHGLFDVAGQVAAGDKGKLFWLPETRAAG